ncbi:hypothetical protein TNIN_277481, partial [Trichonephila inaurata madagascariensis]
ETMENPPVISDRNEITEENKDTKETTWETLENPFISDRKEVKTEDKVAEETTRETVEEAEETT